MAKMLKRELNEQDRALLANLTLQPGWKIVLGMFDDMCQIATAQLLQLDPTAEGYSLKLTALQMQARITNDVCSSLLKSVEAHINSHVEEREAEDAALAIASRVRHRDAQ